MGKPFGMSIHRTQTAPNLLALLLVSALSLPAAAQSVDEQADEARQRQAELARQEAERQRDREREVAQAAREAERQAEQAEREAERSLRQAERVRVDVEVQMREAESRLAEAARRVAQLSSQRLQGGGWSARLEGRPVLGVNVMTNGKDNEPVAGVEIRSVTPGGAAAEAGLRAGDVMTAINGESLGGDNAQAAGRRLLDFMMGVEEGDELDIEYLRNGRSAELTVAPRAMTRVFTFNTDGFKFPKPPAAPAAVAAPNVRAFTFFGGGFGQLEMVKLTEGLGRYFGSDRGLLVVRAPKDRDTYKLEDGDVILDIDGREPGSVQHAVRILSSYQAGEALKLNIMRDQRRETLDVRIPENRSGARMLLPPAAPIEPAAPASPSAPAAPSEAAVPAPSPAVVQRVFVVGGVAQPD